MDIIVKYSEWGILGRKEVEERNYNMEETRKCKKYFEAISAYCKKIFQPNVLFLSLYGFEKLSA